MENDREGKQKGGHAYKRKKWNEK